MPEKIFIIYSRKDEEAVAELEVFLEPLVDNQSVAIWRDRKIEIGADWDAAIRKELDAADLILVVVSAHSIASRYINRTELDISFRRHAEGKARIVPVILRPCLWDETRLASLQALPADGKPISQWPDRDDALHSVASGLSRHVKKLREGRSADKSMAEKTDAETARQKREAADRLAEQERKAAAEQKCRALDPFADEMVFIEGGEFEMGDVFGDSKDENWGKTERPLRMVSVPGFWMQKTAVSQAQWLRIMETNPSKFKGDDLPVENVSWDDAQIFIKKLNERTGLKYRLPSEAEWEFAAREGGKTVRFGNGRDVARPTEMNFEASEKYKTDYSVVGEYREKTVPVLSFQSNALGLYQMSGNVWDWCEDDWHGSYDRAPRDGSAWVDSPRGSDRVFRGGGWGSNPRNCRAAFRNSWSPGDRHVDVGFRLARPF